MRSYSLGVRLYKRTPFWKVMLNTVIQANTPLLAVLFLAAGLIPAFAQASRSPEDADYEARRAWLIGLYEAQPRIRNNPKYGLPDAYGRLVASGGTDEEAKAYIARFPNSPNAMFDYPWVAKSLYGFRDHFSSEQIEQIKANVLERDDFLTHWTENHAIKRVTSGYLFAQAFPDVTWKWREGDREISSQKLMDIAKDQLRRRGQGFFTKGNSEQLSTTYAFLNTTPLLALAAYAHDPEVKTIAEALLYYHLGTIATNNFDGHLMPPLNRRAPQMRIGGGAIHFPPAWLLWGHGEVVPRDFLEAGEPNAAISFAGSDWQVPEVFKRIGEGAGAPYDVRSWLPQFAYWGAAEDWELLRFMHRNEDYALGFPVGKRFRPENHFNDFDEVEVVWKSKNKFRQLEVFHPYWRSNQGSNYRRELTSPFMQATGDRNTILVMFNIPDADPWPARGADHWLAERNEQFDNLRKDTIVRFPATVDEIVEHRGGYFIREGNVYIAVRPMRDGHRLDRGPADWFHTIRTEASRAGYVIEVGTSDQFDSFQAFQRRVLANPLTVDWRRLEARYRNSHGQTFRMAMSHQSYSPNDEFYMFVPRAEVGGTPVDTRNWPVFESPVVSLIDRILTIEEGGDRIIVDWQGEIPRISR
jgi:hypothetical protein